MSAAQSSNAELAQAAKKLAALCNTLCIELQCGVCHNLMTDVRRTTCGHWYDLNCIEEVMKNKPAGQRNGACPECQKPIVRRSLKEDVLMQVLVDKVTEAKEVITNFGLESEGQHSGDTSDSSASASSAVSSFSSTSSDSTPEKEDPQEKSVSDDLNTSKNSVLSNGSHVSPSASAVAQLSSDETARKQLPVPPDVQVMGTPSGDDSFIPGLENIDPNFDVDAIPKTPELPPDFNLEDLFYSPSNFPVEDPNRSIAESTVSHVTNSPVASVTNDLNSTKKRLFDGLSDLSASSSGSGEADAVVPDLGQMRSASDSPVEKIIAPDIVFEAVASDSVSLEHVSQFFAAWPYQSPDGDVVKDKEIEAGDVVETGRAAGGEDFSPKIGKSGHKSSPMPSFLSMNLVAETEMDGRTDTPDATSSQGTQTSFIDTNCLRQSTGNPGRRSSCGSNGQFQLIVERLITPVVRDVLTDVMSQTQKQ